MSERLKEVLNQMNKSQLVEVATDVMKNVAIVTRWECYETSSEGKSINNKQSFMLGKINDGIHDLPDRLNELIIVKEEEEQEVLNRLRENLMEGLIYYYCVSRLENGMKYAFMRDLKGLKLLTGAEVDEIKINDWADIKGFIDKEDLTTKFPFEVRMGVGRKNDVR